MNGWDLGCNIAGAVAVIGPILLIYWYVTEVKRKIKKLNKKSEN